MMKEKRKLILLSFSLENLINEIKRRNQPKAGKHKKSKKNKEESITHTFMCGIQNADVK